ncbi:antitoxin [Pseudomonas sp. HMWF031]|nr:antitoxin [Pseudomonas sp. HMWF031]
MFAEVMREDAYHSYRIRLESLLGIPLNACDHDIHKMIEAGFAPAKLKELYDIGMINASECDQIIAPHTLKARLTVKKRLTLYESDRLYRYVHITSMAAVLFGDEIKARRWLSKPKGRFAGRTPLDMLSTFPGTRQVELTLMQVAEPFAF